MGYRDPTMDMRTKEEEKGTRVYKGGSQLIQERIQVRDSERIQPHSGADIGDCNSSETHGISSIK